MVINAKEKAVFKQLQIEMKQYLHTVLKDSRVGAKYKIRCIAVCCGYLASKLEVKTERALKILSGKNM